MVGQNVLDLLNVLPGSVQPGCDSAIHCRRLSLDTVNATSMDFSTVSSRDSASLWGRQVLTTNVINPDLVGEIKLILSPVDAELGRGNAQIQIQTRFGTNNIREAPCGTFRTRREREYLGQQTKPGTGNPTRIGTT